MRHVSLSPLALAKATLFAAILLAACEDDVVYQDRPPFNPPPAGAGSFLGYYDAPTQQTTCGNCHADYQGSWSTTKHGDAYATLNAAPGKQDSCFGCHTVNGRGNAAAGTTAGWDGAKDPVYHDVQCESCHGAGLEHVEGVGQGNLVRPLAELGMNGTGNCGDCHSGTHHPFAEEWKASRHANVNTDARRIRRASAATRLAGHSRSGASTRTTSRRRTRPTTSPATCAVCHDPHGSANPAQLRFR